MKIILIGIQGSGKSTQGQLLAKKLGVPYLSTGHIFRQLAKEHSPLGRQIKVVMNAGLLISDARTLKIVSEYLTRAEYKKGYILDGFPRTLTQSEKFVNGIDAVIYLKISDKEALWRISGRRGETREDETLTAIRKRIDLFHKFTEPVLDFYRKKGKLIEVDGERPIEEIHKDIVKELQHHGKH
ncbi:MAG: nucleoside monophosphate kinase [Candidatus Levybacteria bacterium]|nr:nucleoside monophosphate kinase [Candidatus Levybacteria bacterium]